MSLVNEKQRQRVYTKWNETYPNQMANEVEVYVSTNGNNNNRRWVWLARSFFFVNSDAENKREILKKLYIYISHSLIVSNTYCE